MITEPGKARGKAVLELLEEIKDIDREGKELLETLKEEDEPWKAADALFELLFSEKEIEDIENDWNVPGILQKIEGQQPYPLGPDLVAQIGSHFGKKLLIEMDAAYTEEVEDRKMFVIRWQFGKLHMDIMKDLEKENRGMDYKLRTAALLAVRNWAVGEGFELNERDETFCAMHTHLCSFRSLEESGDPIIHNEIDLTEFDLSDPEDREELAERAKPF